MNDFSIYELRVKKQKEFISWVSTMLVDVEMTQKELANSIGCDPTYLCCLLNFKTARSGSKWNGKIKTILQKAFEEQSTVV